MPKYVYRRPRSYRSRKPSYTVNRKFCRNLTWNRLTTDSDIYTSAVQLVYNPSVESSNQLGISTELSVDGVGGFMGAIASWSAIDILPHSRLYRNFLYFRVDRK